VYFAHELGLQLVAETSRAVFVSVTRRNKNHMQRGKAHLSFHHDQRLECQLLPDFEMISKTKNNNIFGRQAIKFNLEILAFNLIFNSISNFFNHNFFLYFNVN
jgi:hypothetical protein